MLLQIMPFTKILKKNLKRELNFKLSNLYKTVFNSKNGISLDGKQKIFFNWIGKQRKFLASHNKGTGME